MWLQETLKEQKNLKMYPTNITREKRERKKILKKDELRIFSKHIDVAISRPSSPPGK